MQKFKRIRATLRLMPALAWLAVQLSMGAMPISAQATTHSPGVQALFDTLGVDRVVLCTPEGKQVHQKHDHQASHDECRWCQGFASTILPAPPAHVVPAVLSSIDAGFHGNVATVSCSSAQTCNPSRAPPVLI